MVLLVNGELKNIGRVEPAAQLEFVASFKFLEYVQEYHKIPNQGKPCLGRDSKRGLLQ